MRNNTNNKTNKTNNNSFRTILAALIAFIVFASAFTTFATQLYADRGTSVNLTQEIFDQESVPEKFNPSKDAKDGAYNYKLYFVLANDKKTLLPHADGNPMLVKGTEPGTVQIPEELIPDEIGGYSLVNDQLFTVNVIKGTTVSAYILYDKAFDSGDTADVNVGDGNAGGGDTGDSNAGSSNAGGSNAGSGDSSGGGKAGGGAKADTPNGTADNTTGGTGSNTAGSNTTGNAAGGTTGGTGSNTAGGNAAGGNNGSAKDNPAPETASYTIRFMLEDGVTPAPGIEPNPLTIDGEPLGKAEIPADYRPASLADGLFVLASPAPASVDVKADNSAEVILTYKAANGYGYEVIPCDANGAPLELDGNGNDIEPYYSAKPTFGETSVYFPSIEGYRKVAGQPDTVELTVYNNKNNPVMINAIYEFDPNWRGAEYDVNYLLYDDESFLENYPGGSSITSKGKRLGLQGVTEFMPYFIDDETGDTYRLTADQDLTVNVVPGNYIYKDIYYQLDNRGGSNRYEVTLNYKSKGGDDGHEFDYTPNPQVIWGLTEGEEINLAFYYPTEYNGYRIVELPDNKLRVGDSDKAITLEYEYRAPTAAASDNYSVFCNYSFDISDVITITPPEKAPTPLTGPDADNGAGNGDSDNNIDSDSDSNSNSDSDSNRESGSDIDSDIDSDVDSDIDSDIDTADDNADDHTETEGADIDKNDVSTGNGDDSATAGGSGPVATDGLAAADGGNGTTAADVPDTPTQFKVYYYLGDGVNPVPEYGNTPGEFTAKGFGVANLREGEHYPLTISNYVLLKNQSLSVYVDSDGTSAIALFYGSKMQTMSLEQTGLNTYTVDAIRVKDAIVTGKGTPGATIITIWPQGTKSGTRVGHDDNWAVAVPNNEKEFKNDEIIDVSHTEIGKSESKSFPVKVGSTGKEYDDKLPGSGGDGE